VILSFQSGVDEISVFCVVKLRRLIVSDVSEEDYHLHFQGQAVEEEWT
jgi:hypothetical protein